MERIEDRKTVVQLRDYIRKNYSVRECGRIPVISGVLASWHARRVADQIIRLSGLEMIRQQGFGESGNPEPGNPWLDPNANVGVEWKTIPMATGIYRGPVWH